MIVIPQVHYLAFIYIEQHLPFFSVQPSQSSVGPFPAGPAKMGSVRPGRSSAYYFGWVGLMIIIILF